MLQHRFVKILEIELSTELYLNYPSVFFYEIYERQCIFDARGASGRALQF